MPETSDQPIGTPATEHRWVFLRKGPHLGAFFLMSVGDHHFVWTYDERITPCMHYFRYESRDVARERLAELLKISKDNGWTIRWQGRPNNAALS